MRHKYNQRQLSNIPRRGVYNRIHPAIFNYLKGEAEHNNVSVTELYEYYFYAGFCKDNPKRADIIIEHFEKEKNLNVKR